MTTSTSRTKPKALYLLGNASFQSIYGPEERHAISELVEILPSEEGEQGLVTGPENLAQAEIIFSGWGGPKLDEDFLAAAPNLKLFLYGAGSLRALVTDAFWKTGIPICSAWSANGIPVAEFTLAQIILGLKRAWPLSQLYRQQHPQLRKLCSPGNYGTTVGLISLGMIGRHVRGLLQPFDHKVIAYDPFFSPDSARKLNVELRSLEEVFAEADVVSIHTPWLPETEKVITGELIASMKPGTTLINTSRGAVIDEPAMIEVLQKRPDIIALLDVTHPEPPVKESPLYTMPNVVLTPHIAGSMDRECRRMSSYMISDCERFLHGESLHWAVTREQFQRMA